MDDLGVIKCIVFDFDGVLVDSNRVKRNAYFDIFASLKAPGSALEAVVEANREGDRYQVIDQILRRLIATRILVPEHAIDTLIQKYAEDYNSICEEYAATCSEMPGVSACLPELATKFPLYVNSATLESSLRRIVHRRGWCTYFRDVLGRPWTKIEILMHIMEQEKTCNLEVVFVGDEERDFAAAEEVGCWFVGFLHATSHFESSLVHRIRNLSDLPDRICQINRTIEKDRA